MSVLAVLVILVIAILAAGLWTVVNGAWNWRASVAMFVFALALLWLPTFIHP